MKKRQKRMLALCLAIIVIFGIGCGIYLSDYYRADAVAESAMAYQGEDVEIEENGTLISFIPKSAVAGMIFYPGGKVQREAYAPLMLACAQRGVLCVLVKMPGNLAVLKPNAAAGIQEKYPQIKNWYIGGHSLGGAMAANYVSRHTEEYQGLILLAAYSTSDLSQTGLKVLSIYGSEDGVLNRKSYEKNRTKLPEKFTETVIEGGCHGYFGCYGMQKGDGTPTITNEEQIRQTAEDISAFIEAESSVMSR